MFSPGRMTLAGVSSCISVVLCLVVFRMFGYSWRMVGAFPAVRLERVHPGAVLSVSYMPDSGMVASDSGAPPHFYEWKPGYKDRYDMSWSDDEAYITINRDGLNDRYDYSVKKPPETYRIVALGDSFTQGAFAKTGDAYPEQLEDMLNQRLICPEISGFEVLNFGVGGYDMQYAAYRFVSHAVKYSPDLVLWFIKDDDFSQSMEKVLSRKDEYLKQMTPEVKADITKWEHYPEMPAELIRQKVPVEVFAHEAAVTTLSREVVDKEYFDLQTAAVDQVATAAGSPVLLFTFGFTQPKYLMRMKYWSRTQTNIGMFDGVRNIYEAGGSHRPYDEHPNASGYRMIAEDVFAYLRDTFLGRCRASVIPADPVPTTKTLTHE